jgi:hypothetical protein
MVIGQSYADGSDGNSTDRGCSWVVFGKTDTSAIELSDVDNGIGGFRVDGASSGDRSGFSVSGAVI